MEDFKPGESIPLTSPFNGEVLMTGFEVMYKKFTLNIYPNGKTIKDKGHVSVFLKYHPHWYKQNGDKAVTVRSMKVSTNAGVFRFRKDTLFNSKSGLSEGCEIGPSWGFSQWLSHKTLKRHLANGSFKIKIEMEVLRDEASWSFPGTSEVLPNKTTPSGCLVIRLAVLFWLTFYTITVWVFPPIQQCHKIPLTPSTTYKSRQQECAVIMYVAMLICHCLIASQAIVFCILYTFETGRRWFAARLINQKTEEKSALLGKKMKRKKNYHLV